MNLFSRRNQLSLVRYEGRECLEKRFFSLDCWEREAAFYRTFGEQLSLPHIYQVKPGVLVMEALSFPNLLEILEQQEAHGFSALPWEMLGQWIIRCHLCSSMVPQDGNLRNFLWDSKEGKIVGLDFEEYAPGVVSDAGSLIIGHILEYEPRDTQVKVTAARILQNALHVSDAQIKSARERILLRRKTLKREVIV